MVSVLYIMGLIVLCIGLLFLATWLLQWLWNITMPQLFKLTEITFWQAFRLILIAGILFGNMRFILPR